jgi:hypothetical protein
MDPIKKMAEKFCYNLQELGKTLENADGEICSKLLYINKNGEKLRFPSYLRDIAETNYTEHAPNCSNPKTCSINQSLENFIYAVNQQYDYYYEIEGGVLSQERPSMQFFADGQYFDAFSAIREILKDVQISIVLIDGYVNPDTLAFFPGKAPEIKLRILTDDKSLGPDFQRVIVLYNKQYQNLKTRISKNFHDRFLLLDDKSFYHIGASIKDAGNKSFMFSKIEDENVIETIRKKVFTEWPDIYN